MRSAACSSFFALLAAAAAWAAESNPNKGLLKENPFLSANSPAAAAAAPQENIEFAGVSQVGKRTDLIFYDKAAKKSHWIAEGETKEGIAVLRYDARREQVVVKLNGVEKTLPLRKGTRSTNAPTPAPVAPMPTGFNIPPPNTASPAPAVTPLPTVPTAAAPAMAEATAPQPPPKPETPATPESQAKAETEARMLVSDLLEIGMAQRKAYEEAQRKAAEGNAQPTTQQPPAPAQPPPSPQPEKPNGN